MMLPSRSPRYWLPKLILGLRLRCPHCGLGAIFANLFTMHRTCAYCQCRFERSAGDSLGGVYLAVLFAQITGLGGYFLMLSQVEIPTLPLMVLWIVYMAAFCALFYRRARGFAVALLYLFGQVYPDPDTTREYIRADHAESRSASPGTRRERE